MPPPGLEWWCRSAPWEFCASSKRERRGGCETTGWSPCRWSWPAGAGSPRCGTWRRACAPKWRSSAWTRPSSRPRTRARSASPDRAPRGAWSGRPWTRTRRTGDAARKSLRAERGNAPARRRRAAAAGAPGRRARGGSARLAAARPGDHPRSARRLPQAARGSEDVRQEEVARAGRPHRAPAGRAGRGARPAAPDPMVEAAPWGRAPDPRHAAQGGGAPQAGAGVLEPPLGAAGPSRLVARAQRWNPGRPAHAEAAPQAPAAAGRGPRGERSTRARRRPPDPRRRKEAALRGGAAARRDRPGGGARPALGPPDHARRGARRGRAPRGVRRRAEAGPRCPRGTQAQGNEGASAPAALLQGGIFAEAPIVTAQGNPWCPRRERQSAALSARRLAPPVLPEHLAQAVRDLAQR